MIIHNGPLGSLTDSYKWCEVLRENYDITYVELDGIGSLPLGGINRVTVSRGGGRLIRGAHFLLVSIFKILFFKGPIIVVYFKGCQVLKYLFPRKRFLLDIRTLSVNQDEKIRSKENLQIGNTCKLYRKVTIIQEELLKKLNIKVDHNVLPLGADVISKSSKSFDNIRLLYVGTLEGRHIEKTIEGLHLFHTLHPETFITYDIIGEGFKDTSEQLRKQVKDLNLDNIVRVHGRKPYNELKPFFDECNVGVSFVPVTSWFDNQPPTKTFEYVMSGLYCLATCTQENKKLIKEHNGCLHQDNADSFCQALEKTYACLPKLNSICIRQTLQGYSWPMIVNRFLIPAINNI